MFFKLVMETGFVQSPILKIAGMGVNHLFLDKNAVEIHALYS